jgi:hypothetical protein
MADLTQGGPDFDRFDHGGQEVAPCLRRIRNFVQHRLNKV